MRRHWKKLALLLGAALAACVLIGIFNSDPEPSYQGRTLSNWLANPTGDQDLYVEALRHMGTNALRYLVNWGCTPTPRWRAYIEQLCHSHKSLVPNRLTHWAEKDSARVSATYRAFSLLRTNAYSVLPELNRRAATKPDSQEALGASVCLATILHGYPLGHIKMTDQRYMSDSDPVIREAATNVNRLLLRLSGQ
jgi:hypothetical protein